MSIRTEPLSSVEVDRIDLKWRCAPAVEEDHGKLCTCVLPPLRPCDT